MTAKLPGAMLAGLLLLGGCSGAEQATGGTEDRFAGLDQEIRTWREQIVETDARCQSDVEGQACETFEVVCKAERTITPEEQARGVTAKVVAALRWSGWDPEWQDRRPATATALFTRADGAWTRVEAAPVNLSTCADL